MSELTESQIDKIYDDIDGQGLTYTGLRNELADHVCCQIESEMENGVTFNDAYRKVRSEIGNKRVRQIQHETLTLISKKYRRMKRLMHIMGVAAPILLVAGMTFKVFHWPGAGIILTLALVVIGLIFLPLFVMDRIRDTRKKNEPVPLGLYITGMLTGLLAIIGALFKIQHWPGAGVALTLGLAGLAFAVLPMYAAVRIRESKKEDVTLNKRLLIGGVIAGILFILGALFKIQHWPGAGIVIIVSWSLVAVILLPYLVLNQLKKSENQVNNFLLIILVAVAVSILTLSYVRNSSNRNTEGYYFAENNFASNVEYLESEVQQKTEQVNAMDSLAIKRDLLELAGEAEEICSYIHGLKDELVVFRAEDEGDPDFDDSDYMNLMEDHWFTGGGYAYNYITERDEFKLYHMLEAFRKHAMDLSSDSELDKIIEFQLSMSNLEGDSTPEIWAGFYFPGPAVRNFTILSMYESTVRFIENEVLREKSR